MISQLFSRPIIGALAATALWASALLAAPPPNFERAKVLAREQVYFDRTDDGDFYCGCRWTWIGPSGGRVDPSTCGYQTRSQPTRAARTEWEHVVPAHSFGQARQCWQQGGREACQATDPVFNAFESDLHNLTVAVGEVNADRSNYRFGMLPGTPLRHGACPFRVDFAQRVAEPREAIRGQIARTYFYVSDRYAIRLSRQQQQLFMAWDRQHPPTDWERERDRRIARVMGHSNPFVTGASTWTLDRNPSAAGLVTPIPASHPAVAPRRTTPTAISVGQIRGNRRSRIYHLPVGCPSYGQISPQNIVTFPSEAAAQAAGYRRAGNCR